MNVRRVVSLAFFVILVVGPLGSIEITVRDSATGARVAADLRFEDQAKRLTALTAGADGRLVTSGLAAGTYRLQARHPGYSPLPTRTLIGDGELPLTLWLDPLVAPASLRTPFLEPDTGMIRGYVYDAATGKPLAGAVVSLEQRGWGAITDNGGYFEFDFEARPARDGERPASDALLIDHSGWISQRQEVFLEPGACRIIADLEPGEGLIFMPPSHKILDPDGEFPDETPFVEIAQTRIPAKVIEPIDPPPTIRVGTSCPTSTTCSEVSTMSLETYVLSGVADEWYGSWSQNSLRAGSVAYRSYGAWFVANPLTGSYDICSTTSCQAWDSDTYSNTDTACPYTAGFMLERDGIVFRSEYSSEVNAWDDPDDGKSCSNSDLSCGDGYAGSPATSWSCVSDSLCAGYGCYGHGRGMCQWGTQRWSLNGEAWTWIVDHYYNDHGSGTGMRTAQMTTPISISAVAPNPATVAPGGTFQIDVTAVNAAGLEHDLAIIGASLYSAATGYISDPDNDQPVVLQPGSNNVARQFDVPGATQVGSYDLVVSLYFDVDEDSDITTADKALVKVTEYGAVTVSDAAIFADDFESGDTGAWTSAVP